MDGNSVTEEREWNKNNNNNNNVTYIAQIRKEAANALLRVSVKQKCFQSLSEGGQRYVG